MQEPEPITERELTALQARMDELEVRLEGFQKLSPSELDFVKTMASLKTAGKFLVVILAGITAAIIAIGHLKTSLKSWLT